MNKKCTYAQESIAYYRLDAKVHDLFKINYISIYY